MSEKRFWPSQPTQKEEQNPTFYEMIKVFGEDDLSSVPKSPYTLPKNFEWHNMDSSKDLDDLYDLLEKHYGEDDDHLFRFAYPKNILEWAITSPTCDKELLLSIRHKEKKNLVGCIIGVPCVISVGPLKKRKVRNMVEVNFLCLTKELRGNKLVHVLFKEIKRRLLKKRYFHAIFTVGKKLPFISISKKVFYRHRFLNIERLIQSGFCDMPKMFKGKKNAMEIASKYYKVEDVRKMNDEGGVWRKMKKSDLESTWKLFSCFIEKYELFKVKTKKEFAHWFFSEKKDLLYTFVVENEKTKEITDFISFYYLPSTVLDVEKRKKVKVVKEIYLHYYANTKTSLKVLMKKVLYVAQRMGFDTLNVLEIMESQKVAKDLKFVDGDGYLYYYLVNFTSPIIKTENIGLNML